MVFSLRQYIPLEPEAFLYGGYGEWVVLILLCAIFIAVAGATLPKRLTGSRYGKALVISLGLALGIGLYKARELYHFSFESFGFMAIWLMILLAAFVLFGTTRIGMPKDVAFAMTYCVMFLTFDLMTPTLFDAIAESFPLVNLFLLIAFLYLAAKLLMGIFKKHSAANAFQEAKGLDSKDQTVIEKEINEEQNEEQEFSGKLRRVTSLEISTATDIIEILSHIINLLKAHPSIDDQAKREIAQFLGKMAGKINVFQQELKILRERLTRDWKADKSREAELSSRQSATKNEEKASRISREKHCEIKKREFIAFLAQHEQKIEAALKSTQQCIFASVERLKVFDIPGAGNFLVQARKEMEGIRDHLNKMKHYERCVASLASQEKQEMKKEEMGK